MTSTRHLGDFGQAKKEPAEDIHFGYFGTDVRVNPDLSELDMVDFVEAANTVDEEDPKAIILMKDYVRAVVHPEDFEGFWTTARANRQGIEDISKVLNAVIEKVADRPTQPSNDSVAGQSTIEPKSRDDSYSRALAHLEGRPDLQEMVVSRREDLLASASS